MLWLCNKLGYMPLTLARSGGFFAPPLRFFEDDEKRRRVATLGFRLPYGECFGKVLVNQLTGSGQVTELWRLIRYELSPNYRKVVILQMVSKYRAEQIFARLFLVRRIGNGMFGKTFDLFKVIPGQHQVNDLGWPIMQLGGFWGLEFESVIHFRAIVRKNTGSFVIELL